MMPARQDSHRNLLQEISSETSAASVSAASPATQAVSDADEAARPSKNFSQQKRGSMLEVYQEKKSGAPEGPSKFRESLSQLLEDDDASMAEKNQAEENADTPAGTVDVEGAKVLQPSARPRRASDPLYTTETTDTVCHARVFFSPSCVLGALPKLVCGRDLQEGHAEMMQLLQMRLDDKRQQPSDHAVVPDRKHPAPTKHVSHPNSPGPDQWVKEGQSIANATSPSPTKEGKKPSPAKAASPSQSSLTRLSTPKSAPKSPPPAHIGGRLAGLCTFSPTPGPGAYDPASEKIKGTVRFSKTLGRYEDLMFHPTVQYRPEGNQDGKIDLGPGAYKIKGMADSIASNSFSPEQPWVKRNIGPQGPLSASMYDVVLSANVTAEISFLHDPKDPKPSHPRNPKPKHSQAKFSAVPRFREAPVTQDPIGNFSVPDRFG
jgi:hypothetical protein